MDIGRSNCSAMVESSFEWLGWTLTALAYVGSAAISISLIWFAGKQLFH